MNNIVIISGGPSTESVLRDTWGHMAPEPNKKYTGYIILAVGCAGDLIIFDYDFEELDGGPWLWEDVCEFAFNHEHPHREPALYRFDGWYKKHQNGKFRFGGGHFQKLEIREE